VIHLLVFFTLVLLGWRLNLIDRLLMVASRSEDKFAGALPFSIPSDLHLHVTNCMPMKRTDEEARLRSC